MDIESRAREWADAGLHELAEWARQATIQTAMIDAQSCRVKRPVQDQNLHAFAASGVKRQKSVAEQQSEVTLTLLDASTL